MNKKGFFFTIVAVFLLLIVLVSISLQNKLRFSDDVDVIEIRINTMNEFLKSIDRDIERGLFIIGFRSLLAMQDYIGSTGEYVNGTQSGFNEIFINGTLNSGQLPLSQNTTFTDWLDSISEEARKLGIIANITVNTMEIRHTTPWEVEIELSTTVSVEDESGIARFDVVKTISEQINIEGMEDPVYTVETFGRIVSVINRTSYEGNYVSGADTTNLRNHILQFRYSNSTGPSYLMRLEGNFSNSTYGIESILYIPDHLAQGLPIYDRSSIDYVYYGNSSPAIYTINNTFEEWLRIDDGHTEKYQVTGILS